jgi:hypothetical protein
MSKTQKPKSQLLKQAPLLSQLPKPVLLPPQLKPVPSLSYALLNIRIANAVVMSTMENLAL